MDLRSDLGGGHVDMLVLDVCLVCVYVKRVFVFLYVFLFFFYSMFFLTVGNNTSNVMFLGGQDVDIALVLIRFIEMRVFCRCVFEGFV